MNALAIRRLTWIVCGNAVYHCGTKIQSDLKYNLNHLQSGQSVGVYLSECGNLHLIIDGQDQGSVASVGTGTCLYAVADLYGKCVEASIVSSLRASAEHSTVVEEKGHLETSTTEKDCLLTVSQPCRPCEYRQTCTRFISLIGLPEAYLDMEHSHCCCEICIVADTSVVNGAKMDPSLKGWCRFAVQPKHMNVNNEGGNNEKWQVAFHGTRANVVRRILDEGHLLPPNLSIWQRSRAARSSKGHDGDSEGCQLLFSPLLTLASTLTAAPFAEFLDPVMKKHCRGQIVLQVLVQPGSYKVRRASSPLGAAINASPGSSSTPQQQQLLNTTQDDAIIWYTKERGAAIVQALLIRIEDT